MFKCVVVLPLLMGTLSACTAASGTEQASRDAVVAAAPTAPAQRVFRDPVTGALRAPTAEEAAALAQQAPVAAKAATAPETVVYPDGTVGERQLARPRQIRAQRQADGRLQTHCDDHDPVAGAQQP